MARRRKGLPINGWIVVDKPNGLGSTNVVSKARWTLQAQKAGHAGTLDPMATGVLAIAFGEATKTVPAAMDGLKTYRFTVRWGVSTATDDAEGSVVATSASRPSAGEIEAALPTFRGDILQRPPSFSAIKVDGRRAYDLAREGQAPELAERALHVAALDLIETPDADHAVLRMTCVKGGYVRAIARDLGALLGCHGHVSDLRRLAAGPFTLDDAISFETLCALRNREAPVEEILPVSRGLDDIPAFDVDQGTAAQLRQGRAVPLTGAAATVSIAWGHQAWARYASAPVAIGHVEGPVFKPSRVFNGM